MHAPQQQMGRAVRAAEAPAIEGIAPRRLEVYRELVFNNIEGFLGGTFPVLHSLLSAEQWLSLVRNFLIEHRCASPYFLDMGAEFLDWLEQRSSASGEPAFLAELAHYEWIELALEVSPIELPERAADALLDPLDSRLQLSPLARLLTYAWPVHQLGHGHQSPTPVPTFLLVWRDRCDAVRFMEVNAATTRLLELLAERPGWQGRALLELLAAELRQTAAALLGYGRELLTTLIEGDAVLVSSAATRPPRP